MYTNHVNSKYHFTLQWHLTNKCENKCSHCYISDEERKIDNELSTFECKKIIDDFVNTFNSFGLQVRINFTGGDPLFREDLFEIIEYAVEKRCKVGILGNPNLLCGDIVKKLKEIGVFRYQLSLDGLERTHNKIRRNENAFNMFLNGIELLNKENLPSVVMFTVSKTNYMQLTEVIKLIDNIGVSIFDFARYVPSSPEDFDQMLEPIEYRHLLLDVFNLYLDLHNRGTKTYFGRKDNLWKLLYHELGLLNDLPKDNLIYGGCAIGSSILTILPDGNVLSCRRVPINIGNVKKQSIKEIFFDSKAYNDLRRINDFQKCCDCSLFSICRGCPAVAYGVTGNIYSPDPQCWK